MAASTASTTIDRRPACERRAGGVSPMPTMDIPLVMSVRHFLGCDLLPDHFAEREFLDFAAWCHGQPFPDLDALGMERTRHLLGREEAAKLLQVHLLTGLEHEESADAFLQSRIRHRDQRH